MNEHKGDDQAGAYKTDLLVFQSHKILFSGGAGCWVLGADSGAGAGAGVCVCVPLSLSLCVCMCVCVCVCVCVCGKMAPHRF